MDDFFYDSLFACDDDQTPQDPTLRENKSVILGMDANQDIRSPRMMEFALSCGLLESVSEFNLDKPHVATCTKNSKNITIDGIWITPDLEIINAGYQSEMISSDHLSLWVEIAYDQLLGREDKTARPAIKSLLNAENPRLVRRYIQETQRVQKETGTLYLLRELYNTPAQLWTAEHDLSFDSIMQHDVQKRKEIALKIRRKFTGNKAWSPYLQSLRNGKRLWTLVLRAKSGYTVKANQIRRLANNLGIHDAYQITEEEAKERLKKIKALYQQDDTIWFAERKKFLKKLDEANANKKGIRRASERKSRLGIEKQRHLGRKIAQIKNKPSITFSTLYAKNPDGSKMTLNTIREMEQQCIRINVNKFTQANNTEATRADLLKRIGELAEKDGAVEILEGRFNTTGLSKYMVELIEGLKRHETQIQDTSAFVISREVHQNGWRKQKARTGSDTRGLSYAHFKSAATNDSISEVDSLFRNIPFTKGTSPSLWQQITDFQILKKAGVFDVELMRTIQLMMADFNMNNKVLGKLIMSAGESIDYFPEEITGSRKQRRSAITILNKILINDLWRLKRMTAALCSTDAKSCYDRVIHWIAILAMRRINIPWEPLKSLFRTIQQAVHSIAIEENLSTDTYDGKNISPVLHGLGQGNGAAPTIWVMVSTVIVQMLHRRGHGVELVSALSHTMETVCGFMFVDDMDIIEAPPYSWSTAADTMQRMQAMMNRWAGGLRASGGKLEPTKSHWYLISLEWAQHQWQYQHSALKKGLTVTDELGKRVELERLPVATARETLGIYTTMNGDMCGQVLKLKKITTTVAAKYRRAQVTPHEIWTIFQTTLMKTWDYPKVAATLSRHEWDSILGLIIPTLLNKAGLARTFPRLLIFAPIKFQGLGLCHPWIDQNIKQIECLFQEIAKNSFTGKLMVQTIEQTLLEIGLGGTIGHQDWLSIGGYVTNSWIKSIFTFAQQHNIFIHIPTATLTKKRHNDKFIMQVALNCDMLPSDLRRVNNVRQSLQVTTVSDISTLQGTRITEAMWTARTTPLRCRSRSWPRTGKVTKKDRQLWQQVLSKITGSPVNRKLLHPLGVWLQQPSSKWKISNSSGRLYQKVGYWWFDHSPILRHSSRGEQWFSKRVDNKSITTAVQLPIDACNADAVVLDKCIKASRVTARVSAPVQPRKWWHDPILQATWTGKEKVPDVIASILAGSLIAVSDGSHKETHATAAFVLETAAQRVPLITGQIVVPGHATVLSPFRAELFGLFTTIAWIEQQGQNYGLTHGYIRCGFDNQAGFKRLTNDAPIFSHQSDADLIYSIKEAIRLSQFQWELFWVKGHQDAVKSNLTQEEHMNVLSDSLAKSCWADTEKQPSPDPNWFSALEPISIIHQGNKITTFDPHQVYETCYQSIIQQYWQDRHDLSPAQWQQIDWDILGAAMKKLPPAVSRWTTKHLAGFTATSKVMFRRGEWPQDLCPLCLEQQETAEHFWHCSSPQSSTAIQHELDTFMTRLEKIRTSPAIIHVIEALFPPTFGNILPRKKILTVTEQQLLQEQTRIGIYNFFRGRISRTWVDHQKRWLLSKATRWRPSEILWARRMVIALLEVSWNLWRTRCEYLHSDDHPWRQADLQQVIQSINRLKADLTQFSATDHARIIQLGHPSQLTNIDDARKVLGSLQAAQLQHEAYKNSLQSQRKSLRQWLQTAPSPNSNT